MTAATRALVMVLLAVGLLASSACTSTGGTPNQGRGGTTRLSTPAGATAVPWKRIRVPAAQAHQAPLADEPIVLTLHADGVAKQGRILRFVVRIANTGDEPVPLEPCPAYRVQYLPHVETGLLNCGEAPSAITAHGHLDFEMRVRVPSLGRPAIGGAHTLLWQLGGEGFEGRTVQTDVRLDP
jgi:hypothetical protein